MMRTVSLQTVLATMGLFAFAQACSMDPSNKNSCVTPSDCLPGYACDETRCVPSDGGIHQVDANDGPGGTDTEATDTLDSSATGTVAVGDADVPPTDALTDQGPDDDERKDAAESIDSQPDQIPSNDGGDAISDERVPSDAYDGGPTEVHPDIAEPNTPPTVFVASTTNEGSLWLFALPAGSVVRPTSNVVAWKASRPGFVDDVEIQALGREVFVLARSGSNARVISMHDGTWSPWEALTTDVSTMALANLDGYLWACLAGSDGRLRLMSRGDDGTWRDHGDVMDSAATPAGDAPTGVIKLDCTGIGTDLEIFALDPVGHLWHATNAATGWIPFRRVEEAGDTAYVDVDTSNAGGDLHLLISTRDTQYHTILPAGGGWTGFSDVEWNVGDPGGTILASAQASALTEVEWLEATTLGELWISTRTRVGLGPYERLLSSSADGYPFVSVSATGVLPY